MYFLVLILVLNCRVARLLLSIIRTRKYANKNYIFWILYVHWVLLSILFPCTPPVLMLALVKRHSGQSFRGGCGVWLTRRIEGYTVPLAYIFPVTFNYLTLFTRCPSCICILLNITVLQGVCSSSFPWIEGHTRQHDLCSTMYSKVCLHIFSYLNSLVYGRCPSSITFYSGIHPCLTLFTRYPSCICIFLDITILQCVCELTVMTL